MDLAATNLGIRVTKVLLMGLYIFFFLKNSLTTAITYLLTTLQDDLKFLDP